MSLETTVLSVASQHGISGVSAQRVVELLTKERKSKIRPFRLLETQEDYRLYFLMHPEWEGIPTTELSSANGFRSMYLAAYKFARRNANSKREQRAILEGILNYHNIAWNSFTKLSDFRYVYVKHPEWHDLSIRQLQDIPLAHDLYEHCRLWIGQQKVSPKKKREMLSKVFDYKRIPYK